MNKVSTPPVVATFRPDRIVAAARGETRPHQIQLRVWVSTSSGLIAVMVGLAVLTGWATDIESLKRIHSGLVAMNPATALSFLVMGLGLIIPRDRIAEPAFANYIKFSGLVAAAIGIAKLIDLGLGTAIGSDQILFASQLAAADTPNVNPMAPNTALCLTMLGIATCAVPSQRPVAPFISQGCAMIALAVAMVAIIGYIYGALSFYIVGAYFPMALHTGLTTVVLGIGILALDPRRGLLAKAAALNRQSELPFSMWLVGSGFALLLGVVVAAFWGERQAAAASNWIDYTRAIQLETARLQALLQGVESAERGYIVTENKRYLQRHSDALQNVATSLTKLKTLTADNPPQQARVEILGASVHDKLAFIEDVIAEEDSGHHDAAIALINNDRSLTLTDDVRRMVAAISAEEEHLGSLRIAARDRIGIAVRVTEFIGLALLILIGAAMLRRIDATHQTEQRARETEIAAKASAEAANRSKTTFLASMSHEIRTPLNGVIGNLELLAQTELEAEQEQLLLDADKAAKSLLALIGNVLDFAKIEAGKLSIETVDISPASLAQEAVDILQSRARQKGIHITTSFGPAVPEIVTGDPARIRQILLNLIGNAVKFTSQGGIHLKVNVKDWDGRMCHLQFVVSDSGKGFEQSKAQELFLPFTQDYKANTQNFEGTGLGLSICRSLVDTFGGEIGCISTPDLGSSFWFTLPVRAVSRARTDYRADLNGRTVMFITPVAQSEPQDLVRYFTDRGAKVITAAGLEDALAQGRTAVSCDQPIDLAIYVFRGGEWPGPGPMGTLRDQNTVPIIYSANAAGDFDWSKVLRSGAAYLLTPDVGVLELDRNIPRIIGGRSPVEIKESKTVPVTNAAAFEGKRVLVLEDRLVNQTIIQRQLKSLGIGCVIAADGVEGLARYDASEAFDAILCDCSMPIMNGYEFTRRLREREAGSEAHRIPVIAMTANAFREDMELCFDAGMDDFLSKPVTLQRLAAVLAKWIVQAPEAEETAEPEIVDTGDPVNRAVLAELLGGADDALLDEMLAAFRSAAMDSWSEVERALGAGDPVQLGKAAHGAKGEARSAGAVALGNLYERLENAARERDMILARTLSDQLRREVDRVVAFIKQPAMESSA